MIIINIYFKKIDLFIEYLAYYYPMNLNNTMLLFVKFESKLFKYAIFLVKQIHEAEDILSETKIVVLEKYTSEIENFFGWAKKILFNIFLKNYNKNKKSTMFSIHNTKIDQEGNYTDQIIGLNKEDMQKMSVSINPEKNAVEIDRFDKSMEAMNSLPIATKQMLIMRSDGFSYEEIANDLEISVSNVKTSIFRGRKLLSKILNTHEEEFGL